MPAALTIVVANDFVFFVALIAAAIIIVRLRGRSRLAILRWLIAAVLLLGLSYVLGRIGGAVYHDPRPFVLSGKAPLLPHAPDNGFPSDHALLAAALVVLVAMVDVSASIPLGMLALLGDWARVGAGLHHITDVAGSSAAVALAAAITFIAIQPVMRAVAYYVPRRWTTQPLWSRGPW